MFLSALVIAVCVSYGIFLRAWVNEDAFITFRVIDNFIHGFGLRWNIIERVQVYTHPLWLLINIPIYALWENAFHAAIFSGMAFSFITILMLLALCRNVLMQLLVAALFLGSRSVMEYSTSGLENPLSHFLIILLAAVVIKRQQLSRPALLASLVVSAALMNRLDMGFLFLPIIFMLLLFRIIPFRFCELAVGMLPFLFWECFAVFYYGSPFPNSYYAKLGGTLEHGQIQQGILSFTAFAGYDSGGTIALCLALACCAVQVFQWLTKSTVQLSVLAFTTGIACYIAYVVHVGGDYMLGRFYTVAVVTSLCCIVLRFRERSGWQNIIMTLVVCCWGLQSVVNFANVSIACWKSRALCLVQNHGIMDTWVAAYDTDGLHRRDGSMRNHPGNNWMKDAGNLRKYPPDHPVILGNVGQIGYYAGSAVHIVDVFGLGDMFVARIPVHGRFFLTGHRPRPIPKGYLATFSGDYSKIDPKLVQSVLLSASVTRGDLWNIARFYHIYLLNSGWLDRELARYFVGQGR